MGRVERAEGRECGYYQIPRLKKEKKNEIINCEEFQLERGQAGQRGEWHAVE